MTFAINKKHLLSLLERVELEEKDKQIEQLRNLSLGASLLHLAGIDHEREYQTCAAVAQHLLGEVPEPEDVHFSE